MSERTKRDLAGLCMVGMQVGLVVNITASLVHGDFSRMTTALLCLVAVTVLKGELK